MDFKFLGKTLAISVVFMVVIFGIVLYINGIFPGQNKEKTQQEEAVKEIILEGQIGNDPYGWMEDERFFD